jgi:hypothetical protein
MYKTTNAARLMSQQADVADVAAPLTNKFLRLCPVGSNFPSIDCCRTIIETPRVQQ